MVDIELTEIGNGNGSIEIKKICPKCNHEMFFGVKNGEINYTDSVVYWKSSKGLLARCIICETVYSLTLK